MSALCKGMSVLQIEQATSMLSWETLLPGGKEFPRGWCRGTKASSYGLSVQNFSLSSVVFCLRGNRIMWLERYFREVPSSWRQCQLWCLSRFLTVFPVGYWNKPFISSSAASPLWEEKKPAVFIQLNLLLNMPSRIVWPSSNYEKFKKVLKSPEDFRIWTVRSDFVLK